MSDDLRKKLGLVLLAIGLVSTSLLCFKLYKNKQSDDSYTDAQNIAFNENATVQKEWVAKAPEGDEHFENLAKTDLTALRETNEQVIGWIFIPQTDINYPVMQGEDNDFYLNHGWNKLWNQAGSIFLECQNTPDFTDFNTIVYGHNMYSTTMFSRLDKFRKPEQWEKSPYIYIVNDSGVYRYEIFSAYETLITDPAYRLSFNQEQTKIDFLAHTRESSVVESSIVPEITDRILTLSTCSGWDQTKRWVVHARLPMSWE